MHKEEAIESRLVEMAKDRPRFGYQRLCVLLRKEGIVANHKRTYRLYKIGNLILRRKGRKRLAAISLEPLAQLVKANQMWAMDVVHDTLTNERKFRTLDFVDAYTREY